MERRCIASGQVKQADEMIRFVIGPEAEVVPDLAGKLPGRGIWVSAERAAVERAVAKKLFRRGARREVRADAELAGRIDALMVQSCLSLLSLSRRAGQLVTGFEKVRAGLKSGEVAALVIAADAAQDGREKLRRLARARGGDAVDLIESFGRDELSLALGRENVVHAALKHGGLARRIGREWRRLTHYRQAGARVPEQGRDEGMKGTK